MQIPAALAAPLAIIAIVLGVLGLVMTLLSADAHRIEGLVAERTADLARTHERLMHTEFALDRVGIGNVWSDPESGRIRYANDEACRQLGYRREELAVLGIEDFNPGLTEERRVGLRRTIEQSGGSIRFETVHRRKDGSTYPAAVSLFLDQSGSQHWMIGFFAVNGARTRSWE